MKSTAKIKVKQPEGPESISSDVEMEELDVIICPYCQGLVYHNYGQSSQCPNCRTILTDADLSIDSD